MNSKWSFKSGLYYESSMPRAPIPGVHLCTMEFMEGDNAGRAMIEFDIPSIGETEHIGLWFKMIDGKRTLTDYDGVFCIPAQAVYILQQLGIVIPADDGLDDEIAAAAALEGDEKPVHERVSP